MAYIPYGYKIQDGVVTVDEKAAGQVKVFFEKYISGLSLTVAGEQAGIADVLGVKFVQAFILPDGDEIKISNE